MIPKEMFRQLVEQVATDGAKVSPKETINEVILESDLEGVHYSLIRCRQPEHPLPHLSPRERAIALLVAQGFSNKCIGKQLGITHWTVATHLRRIFAKLGVTSRAAMIAALLDQHVL